MILMAITPTGTIQEPVNILYDSYITEMVRGRSITRLLPLLCSRVKMIIIKQDKYMILRVLNEMEEGNEGWVYKSAGSDAGYSCGGL